MKRLIPTALLFIVTITFGGCFLFSNDPTPGSSTSKEALQNGDIIFQTSQSRQSVPIQLATNSPYSHVGIVYINEGKEYVFEAVQPVKLTPLEDWIKRGKDGRYVVKRLKDNSSLTPENLKAMRTIGEAWLGTSYDLKFKWSDDLLYCSELVWKVYERGAGIKLCTASTVRDHNLDLNDPKVKTLIETRYGSLKNVPLEEVIVTPEDLFACDLLETVIER